MPTSSVDLSSLKSNKLSQWVVDEEQMTSNDSYTQPAVFITLSLSRPTILKRQS